MNRQVLNYKHLGERLGIPARGLSRILGHILYYCRNNKLPALTSIVVKKSGGLPGDGYGSLKDIDAQRESVFEYPWYDLPAPRACDLAAHWTKRRTDQK